MRSSLGRKVETQELVVRDTPCLERLLTFPPRGPTTIQVCGAPRLQVLGYLSRDIGKLEIGRKTFKVILALFNVHYMLSFFINSLILLFSTENDQLELKSNINMYIEGLGCDVH